MIKKRYTVIGIKKGKEINLKKFISLKRAKKHAQNLYLILEPLETDISCIYVEEKETEIKLEKYTYYNKKAYYNLEDKEKK